jgi:hypothetical protein
MDIGPDDMKDGDTVAVFFGGRPPFIIRASPQVRQWCLIGDCYIHGPIRGKALKVPKLETQSFILV